MFVDASAIVAILVRENDASRFLGRLGQTRKIYVSPMSLYEATLGVARARDIAVQEAEAAIEAFVAEIGAEIVAIDASIGRGAVDAFMRFGKGRHRAALNLGDCFAYACARYLGVPLLCKGDDFPHTDIPIA
jgi:ribonuclease VapC